MFDVHGVLCVESVTGLQARALTRSAPLPRGSSVSTWALGSLCVKYAALPGETPAHSRAVHHSHV